MGDLDLVGGAELALGPGRAITVGPMQGRSRAYAITTGNAAGRTVISVAFNERCDMIVGTAVLQHDQLATIEPAVLEFLNSRTVLQWVERTLGL